MDEKEQLPDLMSWHRNNQPKKNER